MERTLCALFTNYAYTIVMWSVWILILCFFLHAIKSIRMPWYLITILMNICFDWFKIKILRDSILNDLIKENKKGVNKMIIFTLVIIFQITNLSNKSINNNLQKCMLLYFVIQFITSIFKSKIKIKAYIYKNSRWENKTNTNNIWLWVTKYFCKRLLHF